MRLDDQELEKLLKFGEDFCVEFKANLSKQSSHRVREAICAFGNDLPNSGELGILFIGVNDNGVPTGLKITDRLLLQLSDIKSEGQVVPLPTMLVEKRELMGCEVAVISVMPSSSPPVRYRGSIFVRNGPRRSIATAQEERILSEKRRFLDVPFDIRPASGADITNLNHTLFVNEYLPRAFSEAALEENNRRLEEQLAATKMVGLADEPSPTNLGLLTIGKNPRDYIHCAWVQFLRIDGSKLSDDIMDEAEIYGDLALVIRLVDEKMKSHIRTRVDLTTSDIEIRSPSFPLVALQQISRNAIMHRTYEHTNSPVRISWFNDRIEIQSPGGPFGLVTRENFGQPGITDYRNPNLSKAMKVLGYVQRFGVGISSSKKALEENGNPELRFEISEQYTLAIIEGKIR